MPDDGSNEENEECEIHLQNSVIKGYHHYKIRPPVTTPPTRLSVDREYTNIHDINAFFVWIPSIQHFHPSLHSILTDEKRQLFISDIAGLPIGHVPRELAPCFRSVMDNGGSVYSEVCGEPFPSAYPWPQAHEIGDGVLLPCTYIIKPAAGDYCSAYDNLTTTLSEMAAGSSMTIDIVVNTEA